MSKPKLLNLLENNNIINITIPTGRMMGDVDGDGLITENDVTIINNHVTQSELITDEIVLAIADVTGDGIVNSRDVAMVSNVCNGTVPIGELGVYSGNWTVNPNYATEEAQFYTDIAIDSMTASSSATVSVKGDIGNIVFSAECLESAIRIYANLCPISELHAIVQYGAGDGTAVVVCEDTVTIEDVNAAINLAIIGAIEGSY